MSRLHFTKRQRAIFCTIAFPLVCILLFILRDWIASLPLPGCAFHKLTGYLCPGCGNTRATLALLHLHFLQSFGYNPMMPILGIVVLLLYLETVFCAFGKSVRLLPRSFPLLYSTLAVVFAYTIIRNFFPGITLCL